MENRSFHDVLMSHVSEEHWQELGPLEEDWFELLTRKVEQEHEKKENDSKETDEEDEVINKTETDAFGPRTSTCCKKNKTLSKQGSAVSGVSSQFSPLTQRNVSAVTDGILLSSQDLEADKTPEGKSKTADSTPGPLWKQSAVKHLTENTENDCFLTPPVGFNPNLLHMRSGLSTSTPQSTDYDLLSTISSKKGSYQPAGLEIDDSVASWTSSLVTPGPKRLDGNTSVSFCEGSETKSKQNQGAARMLFSPGGKNTTQEFDIMAGLKELEASQEADDIDNVSPRKDNLPSQRHVHVETAEAKTRSVSSSSNDNQHCSQSTEGQKESAPDPGGGGDSDLLCAEDCFSQRLHETSDSGLYAAEDENEKLELECDEGNLESALLEDDGREGVVMQGSDEPLELSEGRGKNGVHYSSTPIAAKETDASEEKSPLSSPCIDGILSQLFGTPPSRNGITRKPAPKRSRRASKKHPIQNSKEPRSLVTKLNEKCASSTASSGSVEMLSDNRERANNSQNAATEVGEHGRVPRLLGLSGARSEGLDNADMLPNEHHIDVHNAANKEDSDFEFSQLSPGSVSAFLQASDVSTDHFVLKSEKTSQTFKENADAVNGYDELSVGACGSSAFSGNLARVSKTTVLQSPVSRINISVTNSTPIVSTARSIYKSDSPALVSIAASSMKSTLATTSSSASVPTQVCSHSTSSITSAVAMYSASGKTRAVSTLTASSPVMTPPSTSVQGRSVVQSVRTPQVLGKPAAVKSSSMTPQIRPPSSARPSTSSFSRRHRKSFLYPSKKDIENTCATAVYNLEPITVNDPHENASSRECVSPSIETSEASDTDLNTPRIYKPYARRKIHTSGFSTLTNFNISEEGKSNLWNTGQKADKVHDKPTTGAAVEKQVQERVPSNKSALPKFSLIGISSSSGLKINVNTQKDNAFALLKENKWPMRKATSDQVSVADAQLRSAKSPYRVLVDSEVSFRLGKLPATSCDTASTLVKESKVKDKALKHVENSTSNIPDDSFCDIDFEELDKMSKSNTVNEDKSSTNEECITARSMPLNRTLESPGSSNDFIVPDIDNNRSNLTGFSTAKGSSIPIFRKALNAAKNIVESEYQKDISNAAQPLKNEPLSSTLVGFASAKGGKVSISRKAFEAAKKLLESEEDSVATDSSKLSKFSESFGNADLLASKKTRTVTERRNRLEVLDDLPGESPRSPAESVDFTGFSTANGTSISISSKALHTAEKLLEFNDDHSVPDISNESVQQPEKVAGFVGFSTAAGKCLSASTKSIDAARKLLEPEEHDEMVDFNGKDVKFSTLTGSSTNSSAHKEALPPRRMLPESCDQRESTGPSEEFIKESAKSPGFMGFSTAKGTKISISSRALESARKMWDTEVGFKDEPNKLHEHEVPVPSLKALSTEDTGCNMSSSYSIDTGHLSTGKDSVDSAKKSGKSLLNFKEVSAPKKNVDGSEGQLSSFKGFATASGKDLCVANDALDVARKMLESHGCGRDDATDGSENATTLPPKFTGFSTAGGHKVPVTTRALAAARNLLEDDDTSCEADRTINSEIHSAETSGFCELSAGNECQFSNSNTIVQDTSDILISEDEMGSSLSALDEVLEDALVPQELEKMEKDTDDNAATAKPLVKASGLMGFSTASGKSMSVSSKTLDTARKLMESDAVDYRGAGSMKETSVTDFAGFSTAGGKSVSVSNKALSDARRLLEADNKENVDNVVEESGKEQSKISGFAGFATAGRRSVSVSNKALNHARKLLESDDKEDFASGTEESLLPGFTGFTTAKGTAVSVSSKMLHDARKLLESDVNENVQVAKEGSEVPGFTGFTTAKGGRVPVSSKALSDARRLLESDDNEKVAHITKEESKVPDVDEQIESTAMESTKKLETPSFPGFTIAKGNCVPISSKALNDARKLLEPEDDKDVPGNSKALRKGSSGFPGFTTGKGKSVSVSNKALEDARKLLEPEDAPGKASALGKESSGFPGFTTAKGKNVSVSGKALEDARKLLEPEDDKDVPGKTTALRKESSGFPGFTTAKGKRVSVSNKALEDARKLLEPEDDKDVPAKTTALRMESAAFTGFTTAKGHSVSVSGKALNEGRKILETELNDIAPEKAALATKKPQISGFTGFTTAKGNSVSISAKALNSARKFLESSDGASKDEDLEKKLPKMSGFSGFTTAKGSSVSVSNKAMDAARKLLEADDEKQSKDKVNESMKRCVLQPSGFSGFLTAGGRNMAVSDAALNAARKFLETEDANTTNVQQSACTPAAVCNPVNSSVFTGFSTARGTNVPISSKALGAAQRLLESDLDGEDSDASSRSAKPNPNTTGFTGFATAGGSSVPVSSKALNAARKLLESNEEHDDSDLMTESTLTSAKSSGFTGISTAKGGNVAVSEEVLDAAKKLLNTVDYKTGGAKEKSDEELCRMLAKDEINDIQSSISLSQLNEEFDVLDTMTSSTGTTATSSQVDARSDAIENRVVSVQDNRNKALNDLLPGSKKVESSTGAMAASRQDLLEAEESVKAFLEDDDWDLEACQAVMVATTTSQKLESKEPARSWMKPQYSSPEDLCDGRKSGPLIVQPVKSGPEEGSLGSSGIRVGTSDGQLSLSSADRPGFEQKPQIVKRTNNFYKLKPTAVAHSAVSSSVKQLSKFSTPVKAPQTTKPQSGFKTPVKDVKPAETSFKPPVKKKTESSFIPPGKQTVLDGNQSPSKVAHGVKRSHSVGDSDPPAKVGKFEDIKGSPSAEADAVDEKGGKHEEDVSKNKTSIEVSADVKKSRAKARLTQAKRIKEKRERGKVKPFPGTLYQLKQKAQKLPLREYVMNTLPQRHTQQQVHMYGVSDCVTKVSVGNAEDFRFNLRDFLPSSCVDSVDHILLGDGATVVLDEMSTIGKEEMCNGFLDMEGVDPNLISRDWIYNHYKWIVWKSAALEVCFPHCFGARCLTPDRVMLQLKLRYDREVDNSQRSCLKKVYEQDDTPARPMVLCVCGIQRRDNANAGSGESKEPSLMLQLTDGWYSIPVQPDSALTRLVNSSRICIGDKLYICGAEMLGNPEPCPPLQATGDTVVKIFCNSTRKARWDAKLGFCFTKMPMIVPLTSLYPDGGVISCLDVVITRIYPLQYMEKGADGSITFRNERSELRAAQVFEKDRQKHMEILYAKLQKEFEDRIAKIDGSSQRSRRRGTRLNAEERKSLQTGQEIHEAMQSAADPSDLEASLSNHQMSLLCDYRRHLQDQLQAELTAEFQKSLAESNGTPKRNVTSLLKIRLAGLSNSDIDNRSSVVLTIWKPTEDLCQMFTEGKAIRIHNLLASENRGKGSAAVSLTASRSTRYVEIDVCENVCDIVYEPREVTSAADMMMRFQPAYNEVDVVGVVVLVSASSTFDRPSGTEGQVQLVYLADSSSQLYAIKFWGGMKAYGLDDIVKAKSCLGCTNLQWRGESQGKIPTLTASELSTFSASPKESHLKSSLDRLRTVAQDKESFVQRMELKLNEMWNSSTSSSYNSKVVPSNLVSTPASSSVRPPAASVSNTGAYVTTPVSRNMARNVEPCYTPNYTPKPSAEEVGTEKVDPVVAKKRLVQKQKAQRLAQYGSPPKITTLSSPANPVVFKAFKPPSLRTPTSNLSTMTGCTPVNSTPSGTKFKTPCNPENNLSSSRNDGPTAAVACTETPKNTERSVSSGCKDDCYKPVNSITRTRGRKSLGSRRSLSWRKPDPAANSTHAKPDLFEDHRVEKDISAASNSTDAGDDEQCTDSSGVAVPSVTSDETKQDSQPATCSNESSAEVPANHGDLGENSSQQSTSSDISVETESSDTPQPCANSRNRRSSKLSKSRKRKLTS